VIYKLNDVFLFFFSVNYYRFDIDKSSFNISVVLLNKPRSIIKFRHISRNVFAIVRADVLSHRKT